MNERMRVGRAGERHAEAFLLAQGWRIVRRNWRCRAGEIDLIAEDGDVLVFVEVRTRTEAGAGYGTPQESVDGRKQRQVRKLAAVYLAETGEHGRPARFDVVSVQLHGREPGREAAIEHIVGAF